MGRGGITDSPLPPDRQGPDVKKRIADRLAAADRTSARRLQLLPLGKDKAAGAAGGRSHHKDTAAGMDAAADMLQVAVNLLFSDTEGRGNFPGRNRTLSQKNRKRMADRIQGRAGDRRQPLTCRR